MHMSRTCVKYTHGFCQSPSRFSWSQSREAPQGYHISKKKPNKKKTCVVSTWLDFVRMGSEVIVG